MEMNVATMPLVSIPVVTYNSSKTVLETLESIKAQTYQNIELIISDDCSTDNTVQICKDWVETNGERFVRTVVLESPVNTGISANGNRAEAACQGEWVKGIAGDDLLMPECVEKCVDYVLSTPSVVYLFGKVQAFGVDDKRCAEIDAVFDYSFFTLNNEQQVRRLLFQGNCIPATATFYNRVKVRALNIKNDSRIPLLEDWPKWINTLRAGVRFHFIDYVLVRYRVGGISTKRRISVPYFRSNRLMLFYYCYPEWLKEGEDEAIERIVDDECRLYEEVERLTNSLERIRGSLPYRLYSRFIFPIKNFLINRMGERANN